MIYHSISYRSPSTDVFFFFGINVYRVLEEMKGSSFVALSSAQQVTIYSLSLQTTSCGILTND